MNQGIYLDIKHTLIVLEKRLGQCGYKIIVSTYIFGFLDGLSTEKCIFLICLTKEMGPNFMDKKRQEILGDLVRT